MGLTAFEGTRIQEMPQRLDVSNEKILVFFQIPFYIKERVGIASLPPSHAEVVKQRMKAEIVFGACIPCVKLRIKKRTWRTQHDGAKMYKVIKGIDAARFNVRIGL